LFKVDSYRGVCSSVCRFRWRRWVSKTWTSDSMGNFSL